MEEIVGVKGAVGCVGAGACFGLGFARCYFVDYHSSYYWDEMMMMVSSHWECWHFPVNFF